MNTHIVALYVINILIIIFILYHYSKLKQITDIDKMIKTNFDETNRKFEEVNKAVNKLRR
jgi:hypothetical protein